MKKVIKKDVLVIGAGASGLMFCSLHPKIDFALVEANKSVGKKLRVSGGGRCNITNSHISYKNFLGKREFVEDVLNEWSYKDLLKYFDGVEFIKRKGSQFFCKRSSKDVVDLLLSKIDKKKLFLNEKVLDVEYIDSQKVFRVLTDKREFIAKKVVVASGGVSFKELGASDLAYNIARKFGHKINKTKPALVGLTLQRENFWMKSLSGISIPVKIGVGDRSFIGDMLFAHRGISGPVVLNSSLYWEKGSIEIDFLAGKKLLLRDRKKQISSNLPLPKRFIKEFLKSIQIEDKVVDKLTNDEIKKLQNKLKSYKLSPAGDFGYSKAEVTKGGIEVDEIDSKTMQSRLKSDLYFLGECLDITGELGGYNLHFAFLSAKRACLQRA